MRKGAGALPGHSVEEATQSLSRDREGSPTVPSPRASGVISPHDGGVKNTVENWQEASASTQLARPGASINKA